MSKVAETGSSRSLDIIQVFSQDLIHRNDETLSTSLKRNPLNKLREEVAEGEYRIEF